MKYLSFIYRWSSRELKKIIVSLLKSWTASEIQKINYVQNFTVYEKSVNKTEQKILLIKTNDESKLINFLSKNFPQIEKFTVK